jgi:hypothetical protein
MIKGIWNWLKKHGGTIAAIGGILLIINQVGFSINIPHYYKGLTTDGKILFIGTLNFILTLILFFYLLNRKQKDDDDKKE